MASNISWDRLPLTQNPCLQFPCRFFRGLLSGLLITFPVWLSAQQPASIEPESLLVRSIAYHDPGNQWGSFEGTLKVVSTRPGKTNRTSVIRMDQERSEFGIEIDQDGIQTALAIRGDSCSLSFEGHTEFSREIAEEYQLNCDRARMWRDYYTYVYGLPMKLRDPGTRIADRVERRTFKGSEYLVLEVTYDPEIGSDTWYFYFDPETYALRAYQFFHDPAANDGEYILLEGEASIGGMRLPRDRSWYTNSDETFLGADLLKEAGR